MKEGSHMTETVRKQPVQKRSIEKRNHILITGFQLMTKNGYHNTTTDDIAKAAGVSTGIIYRYFNDKKELFLAAIDYFIDSMEDTYFTIDDFVLSKNLEYVLKTILERFIVLHTKYKDVHEELESLRHSDHDIECSYKRFDALLHESMKKALPDEFQKLDHLQERVHLCIQFMEQYCHLLINPGDLDLEFLKAKTLHYSADVFM